MLGGVCARARMRCQLGRTLKPSCRACRVKAHTCNAGWYLGTGPEEPRPWVLPPNAAGAEPGVWAGRPPSPGLSSKVSCTPRSSGRAQPDIEPCFVAVVLHGTFLTLWGSWSARCQALDRRCCVPSWQPGAGGTSQCRCRADRKGSAAAGAHQEPGQLLRGGHHRGRRQW